VRVALCGRNVERGAELVAELRAEGGEGFFQRADVSSSRDMDGFATSALERYGRLDFAFNGAGIEGPLRRTAEIEEDEFDAALAINLKGVWLSMKHELVALERQGDGGAIVNVSSILGLRGGADSAAYCAAKHGVVGLTRTAAIEYGPSGVRINALVPGAFETPMLARVAAHFAGGPVASISELYAARIPLRRTGSAEELAEVACWLCSPESAYLTGSVLTVDGGWTAG
jgi:NAD(P)-dependent dehydrogenase (short-subunit alcohol dehydrogenase family)